MKFAQLLFLILPSIFLINHLFIKYNFLLDNKNSSPHKAFIEKNTKPPYSGGVFILISLLFLIPNNEINFKIIIFLIFMTGFLSDINVLKSANFRFVIQIFLILFSVIILNSLVQSTRWNFLDNLLSNYYFGLFFTSFCILTLINGTNFIDGLNTIVIGYYLLILIFISSFYNLNNDYLFNYEFIVYFSIILISVLILNATNLLYLGDNGAYLISFFIGILLIDLSNNTINLSPYYIVNLLWYPAYENLFSIIRKLRNKKSALKPDNLHLHQLIYWFVKKNINLDAKIINTLTGIIINLFNFSIFMIATYYYLNTNAQVKILLVSLTVYNLIYIVLKKKLKINA